MLAYDVFIISKQYNATLYIAIKILKFVFKQYPNMLDDIRPPASTNMKCYSKMFSDNFPFKNFVRFAVHAFFI